MGIRHWRLSLDDSWAWVDLSLGKHWRWLELGEGWAGRILVGTWACLSSAQGKHWQMAVCQALEVELG